MVYKVALWKQTLMKATLFKDSFNVDLELLALATLAGAALLGQEHGLDVGEDSALGDGHPGQQLVQLLVVADGEL